MRKSSQKTLRIWLLLALGPLSFIRAELFEAFPDVQFIEIEFPSECNKQSDAVTTFQVHFENVSECVDEVEKLGMSCGCSRAEFPRTAIQPKTKAILELKINNSSSLVFRIEHVVITWKSGRVTKLTLAKKNGFGAFVSQSSLSWNSTSNSPQFTTLYLDDETFANSWRDGHLNVVAVSTTGAVEVATEIVNPAEKSIVLRIVPVNRELTTDIIRLSIPNAPETRLGFILCKLQKTNT